MRAKHQAYLIRGLSGLGPGCVGNRPGATSLWPLCTYVGSEQWTHAATTRVIRVLVARGELHEMRVLYAA